ncbi:DUF192 domain-containing protein [Candidatus Parcubacteria bacterium]|nr:DUF192 domain-containing protein [Candidatus Parcubacteria bacterium]
MRAILIGLMALGAFFAGLYRPAQREPLVAIQTDSGPVNVRVEIADSPREWSRGLMNRRTLAPDAGMLFVFPDDTIRTFWMKDTLIALDVIFLDAQGSIVSMKTMTPCLPRTKPQAAVSSGCPTYSSEVPARYALEVTGGFSERYRLKAGQKATLPEAAR